MRVVRIKVTCLPIVAQRVFPIVMNEIEIPEVEQGGKIGPFLENSLEQTFSLVRLTVFRIQDAECIHSLQGFLAQGFRLNRS